jgi:TolB-like protein
MTWANAPESTAFPSSWSISTETVSEILNCRKRFGKRDWNRRRKLRLPGSARFRRIYLAIAARSFAIAVIGLCLWLIPEQNQASFLPEEKSIAVLPFENFSPEKDNAFFAQGIQDEIITTLSRISGLRVISRTSTARYSSAPENLPEIARQLRVSHVLEGSVQKAGDRVHINVQLIRADDDAHLWAQSYDRELTDIFGVEAEVAKMIADSLQATLSPKEKTSVETKPTQNADAYVFYLVRTRFPAIPIRC